MSDVLEGCLSAWVQLLANVLLLRSSSFRTISRSRLLAGLWVQCFLRLWDPWYGNDYLPYTCAVPSALKCCFPQHLQPAWEPLCSCVFHVSVSPAACPQGPSVGSWATRAIGALTPETVHSEQLEWVMLGFKANFWGFLQPAPPFCIDSKQAPTFQQCQHPETLSATLPIPEVSLSLFALFIPSSSIPVAEKAPPLSQPPCPVPWSPVFPFSALFRHSSVPINWMKYHTQDCAELALCPSAA